MAYAQANSNTSLSPTTTYPPSLPPSPAESSPAPDLRWGPPTGYHMNSGINVSVSVLVGLCFLLGLCAGFVRIRQQQRRHRVSHQRLSPSPSRHQRAIMQIAASWKPTAYPPTWQTPSFPALPCPPPRCHLKTHIYIYVSRGTTYTPSTIPFHLPRPSLHPPPDGAELRLDHFNTHLHSVWSIKKHPDTAESYVCRHAS